MNVFLSNLILFLLASFLEKSHFKDKNKVYSLFSKAYINNFVMYVFSSKEVNVLQKVDFFKPQSVKDVPFLIPQKNKNFLPYDFTNFKNSFHIRETFYPKALLKVKSNQNIVENQYIDVFVFDKTKIIVFALFCTFSMVFYEFFKKIILKETLRKELLKDTGLDLKKDLLLKLRKNSFLKFLDTLQDFFDASTWSKVKDLVNRKPLQKLYPIVLNYSVSIAIQDSFFFNEYIFMDKVNEQREESTFTLSCKHYFLSVKKNDIIVLTRDFPAFSLFAGTKGVVDRVFLHQKLEITFFTTSNLPEIVPKFVLSRYQTSIVKENDIAF